MELKFAAAARPNKLTPEIGRRQKLVTRIDQQIGFVRQISDGLAVPAAWVWMDKAGQYFLPIKYGRKPLELKRGMYSIQCSNLDEVEHALCAVRAMILAGELDEQIGKAAETIRKGFRPAK